MKRFTDKEDRFLIENYLSIPAKRLSKMLGRSESAARQRMTLLGLVVPKEIVEQRKVESRIKKGNIPMNKGRKMSEWMTPESIERSKVGRFSKGNLPHNTKSDLQITIRRDKRGVEYQFIRTALGQWEPLHRFVWQQANGPIPKGMKLIFLDKNPKNTALSNLELVSCSQLMRRNSVQNYPKPIALAVQLRGVLNRQINKHSKKLKDEK